MRLKIKKGSLTHHVPFTKSWLDYSVTWLMQLPTPPSSLIVGFIYSASYTGHFCLRGGEEQRALGPSFLVHSSNPDWYTEHGSKNWSGGIDQLQMENKSVRCIAVPENRLICWVYLLNASFPVLLMSLTFYIVEQSQIAQQTKVLHGMRGLLLAKISSLRL